MKKETRVGYKLTKLGWIPEEWGLCTVKKNFILVNGRLAFCMVWKYWSFVWCESDFDRSLPGKTTPLPEADALNDSVKQLKKGK